jgi:predicted TIM-barrel enzyme
VADVLSIAQDVIGTHFKVNGNASNAVDANRVKRFMDQVVTLH